MCSYPCKYYCSYMELPNNICTNSAMELAAQMDHFDVFC